MRRAIRDILSQSPKNCALFSDDGAPNALVY